MLKIGSIFDHSWASTHAEAAAMAVRRVNEDSSILSDFELELVHIDVSHIRAVAWLAQEVYHCKKSANF